MDTYAGQARFTDDGGTTCEIAVDIEAIGGGEWAGILTGPVDWAALIGDRPGLLLALPDGAAPGFPRFSHVRVDLAIGDRAGANGVATVVEVPEPGTPPRRRRRHRAPAIHWHAAP